MKKTLRLTYKLYSKKETKADDLLIYDTLVVKIPTGHYTKELGSKHLVGFLEMTNELNLKDS